MDIGLSQQGAMTVVSQNANHPTSKEAANGLRFRAVCAAADGEFVIDESMFMYLTMISPATQRSAGGHGLTESSRQS